MCQKGGEHEKGKHVSDGDRTSRQGNGEMCCQLENDCFNAIQTRFQKPTAGECSSILNYNLTISGDPGLKSWEYPAL